MNKEEKSKEHRENTPKGRQHSNDQLCIKQIQDHLPLIPPFVENWNGCKVSNKETFWNNLVFIDLDFYIRSYRFQEEFLWDRRRRETNEIKQFAIEMIKDKVMDESTCKLKEGVSSFTYELLDLTAEYVTKRISNELYFYERFHPFELIKSGIFGFGCGIDKSEHLIKIEIDLNFKDKNQSFKETLMWNILDDSFSPEDFAMQIIVDLQLSFEFKILIANAIRKQIKDYVFDLFEFVSQKQKVVSLTSPISITNQQVKPSRRSDRKNTAKPNTAASIRSKSNITSYLFDSKLTTLLGNKTHRNIDPTSTDMSLPSYLRNSSESLEALNRIKQMKLQNESTIKQINHKEVIDITKEETVNSNIIYCDCQRITIKKSCLQDKKIADLAIESNDEEITTNLKTQLLTQSNSISSNNLTKHSSSPLSNDEISSLKCID